MNNSNIKLWPNYDLLCIVMNLWPVFDTDRIIAGKIWSTKISTMMTRLMTRTTTPPKKQFVHSKVEKCRKWMRDTRSAPRVDIVLFLVLFCCNLLISLFRYCDHPLTSEILMPSTNSSIQSSIRPFIHPYIHSFIHLSIPTNLSFHSSIFLFIHPSSHLSIQQFACLFIHPTIQPFIHPSKHSSIYPSIRLFIHISIYSSIHPSAYSSILFIFSIHPSILS